MGKATLLVYIQLRKNSSCGIALQQWRPIDSSFTRKQLFFRDMAIIFNYVLPNACLSCCFT